MSYESRFIGYAMRIGALEFIKEGRKLKNGRISPYFFNSGLFYTGKDIIQLSSCYLALITESSWRPDVVFGLAYKGIPLAVGTAFSIGGEKIAYAFNRKEQKNHGEGGIIVGAPLKDKQVLIVDDVITTGGSAQEAFDIVVKEGGNPIGVAIAFDRQEKDIDSHLSSAQKFCEKNKVQVRAVATLADLISFLTEKKEHDNFLTKILEYKKQYGATCV